MLLWILSSRTDAIGPFDSEDAAQAHLDRYGLRAYTVVPMFQTA